MHGFLAVAKPPGPSSAAVVKVVKSKLQLKKEVGHTGTLDPLATGVLVLGIGNATRFIRFLPQDKSYDLEVTFGQETTTGDAEGESCSASAPPANLRKRVEEVLDLFIGEITQTAPSHCALKHNGRPMYEYARAGEDVPDKIRKVQIHSIKIVNSNDIDRVSLVVSCGPGTYMRSLAVDLGRALDSCAFMSRLSRISCHGVKLEEALADSDLLQESDLVPADTLLTHLPELSLNAEQAQRIRFGLELDLSCESPVRLYDDARMFIGIGTCVNGKLRALRLLPQLT